MSPAKSPTIDLPPTSTAVAPHCIDPAACREWIARLPMMNPPLAQKALLDELHTLDAYTLPATLRLELLEALQRPMRFVQQENAPLYAGKPLPLAPIEQAALETTHALWQAALMGYLRCLQSLLNGEAGLRPKAALVCERALILLVEDFADLTRGGWLPDTKLWRFAHLLYSSAETLEVTQEAVADPARAEEGVQAVSPEMAYVELALLAMASLHELAPRQQRWVMRWARRWAVKVKVLAAAPPLGDALPLSVDLAGDAPPRFLPYEGPGARWLDPGALQKSMMKRLVLLARQDPAVTPASLGLGEDCTLPSCAEVLRGLYPRWVKGGVRRRQARYSSNGHCRFVAGIDAIHYYVSGHQPFRPPGSLSDETLRRQRETMEMFDGGPAGFAEETSRELGFQIESWTLAEDWGLFDRSEAGLCLTRPIEREGGRLAIGQLVAVQPASSGGFLLGVVRWTQRRGNDLATGIQLMPGRPEAVAVRRTGVMATPDPYRPGFILPAVEAARQPVSLILPLGSFKAGRIMEVRTPPVARRFRLEELIERGADFERVRSVEVEP